MNKGKKRCEILKTIRCQVAKKNGIEYTYTECTYQGECRGTCPKCEEELRYLTRELEKIKQSGKQVAVAGVAAAVIATTATGCSSEFLAELGIGEHEQQIAGAIPMPTLPVENVTMGDPLPPVTEISEVIEELLQGLYIGINDRSRENLQEIWSEYLTEQGEGYDLFVYDEYKLKVTYDVRDRAIEMSLPEVEHAPARDLRGEISHVWNVIKSVQDGSGAWGLGDYSRSEIQTEWAEHRVESGEGYDVFVFLGVYLKVTYHEDGFAETAEIWEDYVTAGEPLPVLPSIGDVINSLQQSQEIYMGSFERATIQVEWEGYLTESGADYDVFTVDGQQIVVTYHEDGWGDSVAFYAESTPEGGTE